MRNDYKIIFLVFGKMSSLIGDSLIAGNWKFVECFMGEKSKNKKGVEVNGMVARSNRSSEEK